MKKNEEKSTKNKVAEVSSSDNNCSSRKINHSTATARARAATTDTTATTATTQRDNHNNHNNHDNHNNQAFDPKLPSRLCVSFQVKPWRVTMAFVARDTDSSAGKRRRERRLRSWLRHARMTVAMALTESTHHSSRGQTNAQAGVWGREVN